MQLNLSNATSILFWNACNFQDFYLRSKLTSVNLHVLIVLITVLCNVVYNMLQLARLLRDAVLKISHRQFIQSFSAVSYYLDNSLIDDNFETGTALENKISVI